MKNNIKTQKGITLIALVITIVVMLILAGISINLTIGENGIFTRTKEAKSTFELAQIKEQIQQDMAALEMDAIIKGESISSMNVVEVLEKYGTVIYLDPEDPTSRPIGIITADNQRIMLEEIFEGEITAGIAKASGAIADFIGGTAGWGKTASITLPTKTGYITKYGTSEDAITSIYSTPFTIDSNRTIFYQYSDGSNVGEYETINITNIDTLEPTTATCSLEGTAGETSFTLLATGNDNIGGSGIASYEFYVDSTLYKTVETSSDSTTCIVSGRTAGTTYQNCYVVVTDKVGKTKTSSSITVTTEFQYPISLASVCNIGEYVQYPKEYSLLDERVYNHLNGWRVLNKDINTGVVTLIATELTYLNGETYSWGGTADGAYRTAEFLREVRTDTIYHDSRYATGFSLAPQLSQLDLALEQGGIKDSNGKTWLENRYGSFNRSTEYSTYSMFLTESMNNLIGNGISAYPIATVYGNSEGDPSEGGPYFLYRMLSSGDIGFFYGEVTYFRAVVYLKPNIQTTGKTSNAWVLVPQ